MIGPSHAASRLFRDHSVITIAFVALDLCVDRPTAAMILTIRAKGIPVLYLDSQCHIRIITIQIYHKDITKDVANHGKLTLNVRRPNYHGLTRSIPRLLMPWLLTSPGRQQPWYSLCIIGRLLSYLRISITYIVSMWRYDTKCTYMFMLSLAILAI